MFEVKHTPGPWAIDLERPMTLGGDSREVYALTPCGKFASRGVANLMFDTDEYPNGPGYLEDVANARLIAAAPDMLAALEALIAPGSGAAMHGDVWAKVRLALDKAKGGA